MTRVGKILVLLLSALSVLFLGFAMSAASSWTDWPAKYKAEVTKLEEQTKKRGELQQKQDDLSKAITNEATAHQTDRQKFKESLNSQDRDYAAKLADLRQATDDVLKHTARSKEALDKGSALRKEGTELLEKKTATQQERDDAMKERFALEQQRNQLEGSDETITARREALKQRIDKLSSMLGGPAASSDSKDQSKKIVENPVSKK